jgi:threonine dehydrogenase-like Zn-dependent dehydrogenase
MEQNVAPTCHRSGIERYDAANPMNCRTIRYLPKGGVEIVATTVEAPKPGEAQVRALACGVCAYDLHIFKNGSDYVALPGHEGIGQITAVGDGVTRFKPGDTVVGHCMGFAEVCNMPQTALYQIPRDGADINPQDWIVEPVACIVTGLDHCALKAGDRVAVLGCGFMGLMFVQGLGHSLVDQLIAIDVDPARLAMAKQFGATDLVDARTADVAALQKLGIDTVVDCSGSQQGLDLSSKIVRKGGRLNLFGWNHGNATFPGDLWHGNGLTVVNSAPSSALRDPWPAAIRLLDRGLIKLKPLVSHVVPLDEYPNLLAAAARKQDGYLKGVVRLSDPN